MRIFFVRHGQTQANIDKKEYTLDDSIHSLTERGEKQAIHTGKYLNKIGNFDLIISSPRLRCIQTATLISKEIGYKNDIIINKLIMEKVSKIASEKNRNEILSKNKKYSKIYKEFIKTNDPFELINLKEKHDNQFFKIMYDNDINSEILNLKKFLNQLKKLNKKSILVVTHGGIIDIIQQIITNTEFTNLNIFSKDNNKYIKSSYYEEGNTKIMACLLNDGKFKLVIPSNTLHLADLK